MPNDLICKSIVVIKEIMNKITKLYNISDFKVLTNNGKNAGQEIFHMHWHIIPYANVKKDKRLDPITDISNIDFAKIVSDFKE